VFPRSSEIKPLFRGSVYFYFFIFFFNFFFLKFLLFFFSLLVGEPWVLL